MITTPFLADFLINPDPHPFSTVCIEPGLLKVVFINFCTSDVP